MESRKKRQAHAYHDFNAMSQALPEEPQLQQAAYVSPALQQQPVIDQHQPSTAAAAPEYTRPDDPDTTPSLVNDRKYAQHVLDNSGRMFKTFENACPPPACTEYDCIDQGISAPSYVRLTMYDIPTTENLRATSQLPLGLQIQPFAPRSIPSSVPVADFSTTEPPRCNRCRTYINPSFIFVEGGARFVCNMCQYSNAVSADYYQPTDASSRRIDWQNRPELALGTYDLIVPKDYWPDNRPPTCLHHLFMIDVSADAVKRELPNLAVEAIRSCINDGLPQGCKIGIVTFDRSIHFYNLNPKLEQAQMMIMNDLDDPFVPLEEGLFVNVEESRMVIEDCLDKINSLFIENNTAEPAYGVALDVALKALEKVGGKVSVMLGSLPTWGPGSLHFRDTATTIISGGDVDKDLLKSTNPYYVKMGEKYAMSGIGLDLYAFASLYMDITNIGEVSRASGGQEFFYGKFVPQRDGKRFIADFCKAVCSETGKQGQLKVRCSNGLQVEGYYGNLYQEKDMPKYSDAILGTVSPQTSVAVLFNLDGKLDTKLDAHFQSALLYTSSNGERRVRIHNVMASVTEQYRSVMKFVDADACISLATRNALSKVGLSNVSLKDIREGLDEKIIEIFATYRRLAGSNSPPTQLLMPVKFRPLVVYFLSILKSKALRGSPVFIDSRVDAIRKMNSLSIDELSLYLYPRIIGLHNLLPEDCTIISGEQARFIMPQNITASSTNLDEGGVYLMYNGQNNLIIWIHKNVSPLFLQDLFNVEKIEDLDSYMNELPIVETQLSTQVRALISYFATKSRLKFLSIQIARQGLDGAELEFYSSLVEDRNLDSFKYSEYLQHVHRNVKISIENKNAKNATRLLNETIAQGLHTFH